MTRYHTVSCILEDGSAGQENIPFTAAEEAARDAEEAAALIPSVPQQVTSFQAKAALLNAGLLAGVTTYMVTAPAFDQLAWAESATFERASPTLERAATALGMTSAQLDQLFIAAALIVA